MGFAKLLESGTNGVSTVIWRICTWFESNPVEPKASDSVKLYNILKVEPSGGKGGLYKTLGKQHKLSFGVSTVTWRVEGRMSFAKFLESGTNGVSTVTWRICTRFGSNPVESEASDSVKLYDVSRVELRVGKGELRKAACVSYTCCEIFLIIQRKR